MKITFFDNGANMAFENNEQVPKAQKPWILVFAEYLATQGIDPTEHIFVLPSGRTAKVFRIEDNDGTRYNWESM